MPDPLSEFEASLIIGLVKKPGTPSISDIFVDLATQRHWDTAETRLSLDILERALRSDRRAIKAEQLGVGRTMGRWEYQVFSETFPRNMKFYIDHPRAIWNRGRCPNGDLAVLIERVARTLLQRVGAYGWEPMEPVDADSLWENGRVKVEEESDLLDWWGGAGNYTALPIRLELNFRRWVTN